VLCLRCSNLRESVHRLKASFEIDEPLCGIPLFFVGASMKVIYKITYPHGKLYGARDITDSVGYLGSASSKLLAADFTPEERHDFTVRMQILWESEPADKAEVDQKEKEFILALRSNDPAIEYNRSPRWRPCWGTSSQSERSGSGS
jgi:hypothetical protein